MKCVGKLLLERVALSLPVRGAWIEINVSGVTVLDDVRRSPCGERGLK